MNILAKDSITLSFGIYYCILYVIALILNFYASIGFQFIIGLILLIPSVILNIVFISTNKGGTSGEMGFYLGLPGWAFGLIFSITYVVICSRVSSYCHNYFIENILLLIVVSAHLACGVFLFSRTPKYLGTSKVVYYKTTLLIGSILLTGGLLLLFGILSFFFPIIMIIAGLITIFVKKKTTVKIVPTTKGGYSTTKAGSSNGISSVLNRGELKVCEYELTIPISLTIKDNSLINLARCPKCHETYEFVLPMSDKDQWLPVVGTNFLLCDGCEIQYDDTTLKKLVDLKPMASQEAKQLKIITLCNDCGKKGTKFISTVLLGDIISIIEKLVPLAPVSLPSAPAPAPTLTPATPSAPTQPPEKVDYRKLLSRKKKEGLEGNNEREEKN